jgi:hypothetical protein
MLRVILLLCLLIVPVSTEDSISKENRIKPGDPPTWLEIGRLICAMFLVAIYTLIFVVLLCVFFGSVCSSLPILLPMLLLAAIPVITVIAIVKAI